MRGTIVKGIGGFYFVQAEGEIVRCRMRGLFRKEGIVPRVGDAVEVLLAEGQEPVIRTILPRRNEFVRPPIANVDAMVLVMAAHRPATNLAILDRLLVMAEAKDTTIAVCLNKIDLDADRSQRQSFSTIYGPLYTTICASNVTGEGIDELTNFLQGRTAAFAGPSGVGKSTLLNHMGKHILAETGEISRKSQRGKHTTRHVELFAIDGGGFVFDTPGFTSFDVLEAEESELAHFFPEMAPYLGNCRYDDCRHVAEPGCPVRAAAADGTIPVSRYASYCAMLKELQEKRSFE